MKVPTRPAARPEVNCLGVGCRAANDAVEVGGGGDRVRDGAVLSNVFVQQFKALIGFSRVDDDFIVDADYLWRGVLSDAVKRDFYTAEVEFDHRRYPFGAFDHAGSDRCEQQLGRIEGVGSSGEIGVERDRGVFGFRHAPVCIDAPRLDLIFKHQLCNPLGFGPFTKRAYAQGRMSYRSLGASAY